MWVLGNCRPLLPLFNLFVHCSSSLHPGFSQLQYGQRLDGSVINSFPEFSLIDCVTECLVTPRCVSVNYCTGAKFCEINYQRKSETKYVMSAGWVYSEKDHWPTVRCCIQSYIYISPHVIFAFLHSQILSSSLEFA